MSIAREPANWNNDAALLLAQFLRSHTGRLFLQQLDFRRPAFSHSIRAEAVALQAKYVDGYEQAVSNVLELASPVSKSTGEPNPFYPELEDDSAWPELPKREEAPAPAPQRRARVIPKAEAAPLAEPAKASSEPQPPTKV